MLSNYQVLNAESRKYFQQLLLMSGTAIDYNAISSIDHVDEMYAFAQNISQPVDNIAQLIKVLQNAPAQLLLAYTSNMVMKKLEMRAWAPITERKYLDYRENFIDKLFAFQIILKHFEAFSCSINAMRFQSHHVSLRIF